MTVVYYGDEIGMTGFRDDLTEADTRDPYVAANCDNNNNKTGICYLLKSRDPMRTPMQVRTAKKYLATLFRISEIEKSCIFILFFIT